MYKYSHVKIKGVPFFGKPAQSQASCRVPSLFRHPPAVAWSSPRAAGGSLLHHSFIHRSQTFQLKFRLQSQPASTAGQEQQPPHSGNLPSLGGTSEWLLSKHSQAQYCKVIKQNTVSKSKMCPLKSSRFKIQSQK